MSKFKKVSGGSYGEWMAAVIKFKGDKVGCCPILEDGTVLTDSKDVIVVPRKNVPDNLFEDKQVIQLSEDKKSITMFRPYYGEFLAKFSRFAGKEGEPPAPKSKIAKKTNKTFQTFTPLFEILSGEYKGVEIPYPLYYNFDEGDDGLAVLTGGGKSTEKIEEFLDYCIGQFDPPKWPDSGNLLPLFQKMALRADKRVKLIIKKGWIDTLIQVEKKSQPKAQKEEVDPDMPPWEQEPDAE